ncbi:hypothetical protein PGT21_007824 [Puccinia graminis f. sp. tritici]|uniref:Uncharacterized protein n=1 Tax=Puccinia graminis f. sp. tritici TaxID=56615 RepID=A0A5B0MAF0_PUCGR|nr:hypothetical protein PGTUg99_026406 [Puccinia graminis f. sp. tritici]KAA1090631.1 hypothetical protein PGT21_007824 [Puccinia graminis f. sp. tritici]
MNTARIEHQRQKKKTIAKVRALGSLDPQRLTLEGLSFKSSSKSPGCAPESEYDQSTPSTAPTIASVLYRSS